SFGSRGATRKITVIHLGPPTGVASHGTVGDRNGDGGPKRGTQLVPQLRGDRNREKKVARSATLGLEATPENASACPTEAQGTMSGVHMVDTPPRGGDATRCTFWFSMVIGRRAHRVSRNSCWRSEPDIPTRRPRSLSGRDDQERGDGHNGKETAGSV